jgi:hypothetical protein
MGMQPGGRGLDRPEGAVVVVAHCSRADPGGNRRGSESPWATAKAVSKAAASAGDRWLWNRNAEITCRRVALGIGVVAPRGQTGALPSAAPRHPTHGAPLREASAG